MCLDRFGILYDFMLQNIFESRSCVCIEQGRFFKVKKKNRISGITVLIFRKFTSKSADTDVN